MPFAGSLVDFDSKKNDTAEISKACSDSGYRIEYLLARFMLSVYEVKYINPVTSAPQALHVISKANPIQQAE